MAAVTSDCQNSNNQKKKYFVKWCCSVPGCYESYRKENISMHKYPENRELCKLWTDACKTTEMVTKNHRICSDHFIESDFYKYDRITRRKLLTGAVPSKKLPASVEEAKLQTFKKPRKKLNCGRHVKDSHPPAKKPKMEDGNVKTEPFEQVLIQEPTPTDSVGAPTTPTKRRTDKRESSTERAEILKEIELIKEQINPEKRVVEGPRIEATDEHIFQFSITLIRGRPTRKIWHRIQIPASYTFRQFHREIQKAMGWKSADIDYHLHRFNVVDVETGNEEVIVMAEYTKLKIKAKDEILTKIRDYFTVLKHTATYVYDFSVMWSYDIVFEDFFLPEKDVKYPRCVAGEGACPHESGVELTRAEYNVDPDWFDQEMCLE